MSRMLCLVLAGTVALSVLLAACGDPQANGTDSPAPSVSAGQDSETPKPSGSAQITAPSQQPSEEPSQTPEPASPGETGAPSDGPSGPDASAPTREDAEAFIGDSLDSLIAAIGEPSGTDYAPSCLGSGEDGELFYDGFTVYTYREGNTETVQDVL